MGLKLATVNACGAAIVTLMQMGVDTPAMQAALVNLKEEKDALEDRGDFQASFASKDSGDDHDALGDSRESRGRPRNAHRKREGRL